MREGKQLNEKLFLGRLRRLPREKKQEVLDFVEFLEFRERATRWLEFDEWAIDLAKRKGFARLSETDVAQILSDFRSSR